MADWNCMGMTRRGTVLFLQRLFPWFLVTPEDLETGHVTTVEFKRNGQVSESFRRRVCNMWPVYLEYWVECKPLEEIKEERVGGNSAMNSEYALNLFTLPMRLMKSLDMNLPVIDILEGIVARGEGLFGFDGARDGWTEDIELYAPGYLEMEAAGNGADYDHSLLIDPSKAYGVRKRLYEAELVGRQ